MLVFWTAKLGRQSVRFYSVAAVPARRTPQLRRVLETLDPSKFRDKGQNPIYMSTPNGHTTTLTIKRDDPSQQGRVELVYHRHYLNGKTGAGFPSHALGYFYFRPAEPHRPATSASLRFRLAANLETFARGEDLRLPNGEPWSRPLFALNNKVGRHLYDKLIEEGLVTEDVDRSVKGLWSSEGFSTFLKCFYQSSTLYKLSHPFTVDLSDSRQTLLALTESGFGRVQWRLPFTDERFIVEGRRRIQPRRYKGTIRLCFEPSTLPQHAGTRTVVLRVLDEIHPIECVDPEYDGWVRKPQVGELLTKPGLHGPSPLSFHLDDLTSPLTLRQSRFINLLRMLWQSDPALAAGTASLTSSSGQVRYPTSLRHGRARLIKTLDPAKFRQTGQALIDISGHPSLRIEGPGVNETTVLTIYAKTEPPYPAKTAGYLYFKPAEATHPRISGALRFRLAPTTAEDFATGEDLKRPDGTVRQAPIFALATGAAHRRLIDKIVEDKLISQDLQRFMAERISAKGKSAFPSATDQAMLHTLSDPFTLDLSARHHHFSAITDEDCLSGSWPTTVANGAKTAPVYQGRIRVRFEPSTLPEHVGTRTIVVRVLDVLGPIQPADPLYDGCIPVPRVGDLLVGKYYRTVGPVCFDLDNQVGGVSKFIAVLRHLWDADNQRGTLPEHRCDSIPTPPDGL